MNPIVIQVYVMNYNLDQNIEVTDKIKTFIVIKRKLMYPTQSDSLIMFSKNKV